MKISDLVRFFDTKIPPACPICNQEKWEIPVATTGIGLSSVSGEKEVATIDLGHTQAGFAMFVLTWAWLIGLAVMMAKGFGWLS